MLDFNDLTKQLAVCQLSANQAWSLPPVCYTDEHFVKIEAQNIFKSAWLGVGRSDMVKLPGDYITLDIVGEPVILLRDTNGDLKAFANSCRHRGARLLEGDGNCRGIRCPFHSWMYRLNGSLVSAPHMEAAEQFDRNDFGLVGYQVEERLGFVFICLNPSASNLDDTLGDFAEVHQPWPFEKLVTTRRIELEVYCNWKSFLEVFNEYYHLPFVHPDSIDDVYELPDPATKTTGDYASQFGATEGTGGLLQTEQDKAFPPMAGLSGREAAGVRYTWVFPNMTFAAGTDALWVYEAYPLGPNKCRVVQTACFPPETLDLQDSQIKLDFYHSRLDAALAEDIPALENQHRGLKSGEAKQGRFQPLLEANVVSFASWFASHMTSSETIIQGRDKRKNA